MLPSRIESARLVLRAPVPADAEGIFRSYATSADVTRHMMWRPHETVATVLAFVEQCIDAFAGGTRLPYVIVQHHEPDTPIGMLEARVDKHKIELGYVLAPIYWGQGLMPEAVIALTKTALSMPGCFRVQAFCDVDNLKSQRVLDKAGFLREGRHERFIVHPNVSDDPRPCFMYARYR